MYSKREVLSIPNIICYFRILLVPVFIYTYFSVEADSNHMLSAGILVLSGISDFLDGFIARKYNMITDLGKLIDPIADKLTQLVVACTLVYVYPTYIWLVLIILLKDGMLAFAGLYILKKTGRHISQAQMPGKVATAVFFVVSIVLIAFDMTNHFLAPLLILTTFVLMVVAMIYYAKDLYRIYKQD